MAESFENVLETELETLEAIYVSELTYTRNQDDTVNTIELLLHPATGNDTTKQYVCMTLVFTLNQKYPDEPPEIVIRNPRGLGEEEIISLVQDMYVKAKDMIGDPMLYTLIEMAKDSLTEGNIPHCPCVVCLEHFNDKNSFHRTSCYHYFHTCCLYKYLLHTRTLMEEEEKEAAERKHAGNNTADKAKKIMCPVCRTPLDDESLAVTCSLEELEKDGKMEEFVIPPELREKQLEMAKLYEQQKAKGGIIDLEHEKNKYLLNPEDRMPVRSQTQVSMVPKNKPNKSPMKNTNIGSNHTGSSQQYKSKGRGRGRGSYRESLEKVNETKSRPGSTGNQINPSSVSNAVKEEKQAERKESAGIDSKNEREVNSSEITKRSDISSEGNSSRRLGSDSESVSSGKPYYSSEESIKQNDRRSDRYRSSYNEYKDYSSSERSSRGQSGQERRPHYYPEYREKENIRNKERGYHEEKGEKVGLKSKGDQKDDYNDSSCYTSEMSDEFKERFEEEGNSSVRFVRSSRGNVVRNVDRYTQSDRQGVSECESERNNYPNDDENERGAWRDEQRMRGGYADRRGSYRRRDDEYRGRGSEQRNKGSKFRDRKDGHSDRSHVGHDRPHNHHRSYPSQHPHHHQHHNRHGQEKPPREAKESRSSRDEDIEDIRPTGASGTETNSEAGTQDDDEADVLDHSSSPPRYRHQSDYSKKITASSCKMTDNSWKMSDNSSKSTQDTYLSYNQNEYRSTCDKSDMPASKKYSNEENKDRLYKHEDYSVTSKNRDAGCDDENWENEIELYAYERHMIRPEHLAEYDMHVASQKVGYQDLLKERCEQSNIAKEDKHLTKGKICKKDKKSTTKTLAQEKLKSQEDIRIREQPLSQVEGTDQEKAETQSIVINQEKIQSQAEYIYQRKPVSHKEAVNTIRFVLGFFKEEHAKNYQNPCASDNIKNCFPAQIETKTLKQSEIYVSENKRSNTKYKNQVSNNKTMAAATDGHTSLLMSSKLSLDKVPACSSTESTSLDVVANKGNLHKDKNDLHKYDSSVLCDRSSLSKDKSSLLKDQNIPQDENVDNKDYSSPYKKKNAIPLDNTLHQEKPQNVYKNYKKLPPLKFPRKNQRKESKDSSVGILSGSASPGEGLLTSETSNLFFQSGELPVAGGQNPEVDGSLNVSVTSLPHLQTSSTMLNNLLPSCASDLSAAFLNSYLTGYLLNGNLVSPTGLNPNLVSTIGNSSNLNPNLVSAAGNGFGVNTNLINPAGYGLALNPNLLGIENYFLGNANSFTTNDWYILNSLNANSVPGLRNMNHNARSMDDAGASAGGSNSAGE